MSLLEVLVVVAGMGMLFSAVSSTVGGLNRVITEKKLERDVDTLNRAISIYELSGGSLEGIYPHPWWILGKLKSRVLEDEVDQATAFTGSMIDPRLQPVFMSASERASDDLRSVWNPTDRKFEILDGPTESGAHIKSFKLTDDTWVDDIVTEYFANNEEARDGRSYNYASADGWVWNYEGDAAAGPRPEPTTIPLSMGFGAATSAGLGAGMSRLDPPTFSIPAGSYTLSGFPMALSLGNPNDPAVSEIVYSISLGVWEPYDGTPIAVGVDDVVTAQAVSTDTSIWADSNYVDSAYDSVPLQLEVGLAVASSVNWVEAGGPVEPGGPPASPASSGLITLANEAEIPNGYESSSNFMVYWTTDGSDPMSSGTRHQGGPFSGGFGGERVDLALSEWGDQTSLPIQVIAEALDTGMFITSQVESRTVMISPTTLRAPQISNVGSTVTMNLETTFGDMPTGARIYYNLDGTDPGDDGNGNPVIGTEYAGPFVLSGGDCTGFAIQARVYPPAGNEHWFTTSPRSNLALGPFFDPGSVQALACELRNSLCRYAWFTLGGDLEQGEVRRGTDPTIAGDVGFGLGGTNLLPEGIVQGTILRDPTASGPADEVVDLSGPTADAFAIADALAAFPPTETMADSGDNPTFSPSGPGNVHVIEIKDLVVNAGGTVTIEGGSEDWFLFNVTHDFVLNGNAQIVGDVDPSKVIFNIGAGTQKEAKISGGGEAFTASILSVHRPVKVAGGGLIEGQIISQGGNIDNDAVVNHSYSFGGNCE